MSNADLPRRRYAGHGISHLRTSRTRTTVLLPDENAATLLPDPRAAYDALVARFAEAGGATVETNPARSFPLTRGRDVKSFANFITFALRNDLPTIDPYDAAVIWEKWRQAVIDVRDLMRSVRDDDSGAEAQYAVIALDHRSWDVRESLATALSNPGDVADRYCPWKADFFTYERLHPEAV